MRQFTLAQVCNVSTSEIVLQAHRGDSEAISELCVRIHSRLYRFCFYLTGNKEIADDLCQESFIKILKHITQLDRHDNFVSWLFRVTRNLFIDYVRNPRNKKRVELTDSEEAAATLKIDPEFSYRVYEAVKGLPADDRYAVLLVCLEGQSYSEAANLLGISEEAIRCKLYRARKTFRTSFYLTGELKR